MKKRVKQYSDEVKKNAVDAVLTAGMTVTKAARKFKVGRSTLHNWVATEVRARVKKQGIITVKPRLALGKDLIKNPYSAPKVGEMIEVEMQRSAWKHPNGDTFI